MSARSISIFFGILLIALAAAGFASGYVAGPWQKIIGQTDDAIVKADMMHNVLFAVSGLLLLVLPFIIGGKQSLFLMGVVYVAIAALGFMNTADVFLINGQVAMNQVDRYLHAVIAAVLLLAGLVFHNNSTDED